MHIKSIRIKNFQSIKDSWEINLVKWTFVLAWQNEAWKSSILEALKCYEDIIADKDSLNFEQREKHKNLKQEISCKYYVEWDVDFFSELINDLKDIIKFLEWEKSSFDFIETDKLSTIKEYTIIRTFDFSWNDTASISTSLDVNTLWILKSAIKSYDKIIIDTSWSEKIEKVPYLSTLHNINAIADTFWWASPKIILFNDFRKLLPDKIKITDLENENEEAAWYEAVINLQKQLENNETFLTISKKPIPWKNSATEDQSKIISASFSIDWKQKIYDNNSVKIKFFIENDENWEKEISFFVETKDNEFLEPRKRSKGMIWFLSLWLELKAKEKNNNLVLLFDEPWLHLHIKANKDMLQLFETLTQKWHQIIYSTHSPSLIDTNKLHNIWLVFNDIKEWTTVEWLTSSKINSENKRDALQPIAEAMGLEPLKDFSVLSEKNIILEWLSDFWYFMGFFKLFWKIGDYKFIPSIWIKWNNVYPLILFCIWYWLDWLLIMDNWANPQKTRNDLIDKIFDWDSSLADKKILLHNNDEIENIFSISDLKLFIEWNRIRKNESRKPIDVVGKSNKIVAARDFFTKVESWEIDISKISPSTINSFKEIFDWIELQFK